MFQRNSILAFSFLCILIFNLTACKKSNYQNGEQAVIGNWKVDEVKRITDLFSRHDVTSNWEPLTISIYDDYVAMVRFKNIDYNADWLTETTTSYDGDGNSSTQYFITIKGVDTMGNYFKLQGEFSKTGKKTLIITDQYNDTKILRFRFKKQ